MRYPHLRVPIFGASAPRRPAVRSAHLPPLARRARLAATGAILLALPLLLGGCGGSPSTLDSAGPQGARVTTLWWVMLVIAALVVVVTFALLMYATFRRRVANAPGRAGQNESTTLVIVGGAIIPAIILVGVFGFTLYTMNVTASPSRPTVLTIEVIGHRWWWEVRYPSQHVTTANEIHVPVGQPIKIELTSADVIHSFWVPQIQEKTDMIPGRLNTIWFQASHPGLFLGECAEYCGLEHAKMDFEVVAQSPADLGRWLVQQRQPAPRPANPTIEEGQQVFLGSSCVYCHTIAGTNASGTIGPNLTHLASRLTIGAGILPNSIGNLGGWIANSQTIKPGNEMPPMAIAPAYMQPLLAYLESLK